MSSADYCHDKGTPTGSTAYYRCLFLPEFERAAVTALYALRQETGTVADEVSEAGAARMKLDWWRSEVEALYTGAPRHPVTRALQPAVAARNLDRTLFKRLLAAAEADADARHCDDAGQLLQRAQAVAACQQLETEICGYQDSATRDFALRLGVALELGRMLREVRRDAEHDRIHLPREWLDAHRVHPAELVRASTTENARTLFAAEAQHVREQLHLALAALPAVDHAAQCSGLVGAAIELRLLAEIEREGFRLLEHRTDLTPLHKLWIAWRAARRAGRTSARQRRRPGGDR